MRILYNSILNSDEVKALVEMSNEFYRIDFIKDIILVREQCYIYTYIGNFNVTLKYVDEMTLIDVITDLFKNKICDFEYLLKFKTIL